jgi:thiamine biosynthesis protein ThiS
VDLQAEKLTVRELLKTMNFTFPLIVVRINERLVKKENYDSETIADGDRVEAIHLISGG